MNKYNVIFQFTNAFFHQNKYDKKIESKLNINQFDIALKKELIKNKEPIKVVKIRQL